MPSWANGVLQDWANATITAVLPEPLPHRSPLSLLSVLPFGKVSGCGESMRVCGLSAGFWVYQAELVTILNVEPGGSVVCDALFSSGLGFWLLSWARTLFSVVLLCTASLLGS